MPGCLVCREEPAKPLAVYSLRAFAVALVLSGGLHAGNVAEAAYGESMGG